MLHAPKAAELQLDDQARTAYTAGVLRGWAGWPRFRVL